MKRYILFILILAYGFLSCTSTEVVTSWKAANVPAKTYQKILVMGIINEKDRTLRAELENQLVNELKASGYNAISALEEHGPQAFSKFQEDEMANRLKSSGYDAVLTTVLLDKSKDEHYRPGNVRYEPIGVYYNRFGRYYTTVYDRVYTPGYYTTSTNFFLESNLYDTGTGNLLYSMQGKAFDPSSASSLGRDYSKTLIKDMKKNGILAKKS